jgi:ubiquinone/menaquinone biosynthesis C-methylase UbiE
MKSVDFDLHADTYDDDLNRALSASGEDKHYFARGRVEWLALGLSRLNERPAVALDYGCGIGDTSVLLRDVLGATSVVGLDVSERSLEHAQARYGTQNCRFLTFSKYVPDESVDLVYCNGVFHHIPIAERDGAVDYIYRCLRPGAVFSLWENNPWNLGTRYVMARCTFDRDAIRLSATESIKRVRKRGFEVLAIDYRFFFPRFLAGLRLLESQLCGIPFGAQYQVLCRKPGSASKSG